MEERTIVVIEPGGIKSGRRHYPQSPSVDDPTQDEVPHTVDKAKADRWVDAGWAKDFKTGEVGERKPGAAAPIQPDNITQDLSG